MRTLLVKVSLILFMILPSVVFAQVNSLQFDFNKNVKAGSHEFSGNLFEYTDGIDGQAVVLNPNKGFGNLTLKSVPLDDTKGFSVQCWIKTTSKKPTVILSQKSFQNKGIIAQKKPGWVLYISCGTFGWSIGSGTRRLNYERDNGEEMPISDGEWHQITMIYSKQLAEFRLYYDGQNTATYKVDFDFRSAEPLVIGSVKDSYKPESQYAFGIESGRQQLQDFVDAFNRMGIEPLRNDEFIDLIVNPEDVFNRKQENPNQSQRVGKDSLAKVFSIRKELVSNPYTVYQNRELTELKPVSKIYALRSGKVVIDNTAAQSFTQGERLYPSDFAIDELSILTEVLSPKEVLASYSKYRPAESIEVASNLSSITVGVWNIWHGGTHWSPEKDGWDSRLRIAEMIKEKNIDVILLQETYSSGDFIAAELGYYFATTSDRDYRTQGANISVISRYPIEEVQVLEETAFNNVAVKLSISETQKIWAMSNWYGMGQFPAVFDFHQSRFDNSDEIPVLFGGDFNAVPHTDGGDSPASKQLLEVGFTDTYRSFHPDIEQYPGTTHTSGVRIDQLYYKGKGLIHNATELISSWPSGFPSDHSLIVSKFKLDY